MAQEDVSHHFVATNGINMHIAEIGSGPVVLFLHGFPECWYSWRKQMHAVAASGYRAIAPDLRGYGDTDSPIGVDKYTYLHLVGDMIGLLDALEVSKAFLVTHDWGALIGWQLCLFRPDRIIAHTCLTVHFVPRSLTQSMVQRMRSTFGETHYIVGFQEPGKLENIITNMTPACFFIKLFSGQFTQDFGSFSEPPELGLPTWITDDDILYYVNAYKKNGFTPAINYYRALDLSWELTAPWVNSKVEVPSILIIGDKDVTYTFPGAKEYIHGGGLASNVTNIRSVIVVEQAHHFIHQEKPDVVNSHILNFLKEFSA